MPGRMTAAPLHPGYRADIDGLRAVAVLAVVVFHAFPGLLPGGFVGVDVFFVISGFLISTIIVGNLEKGRFSIADFYARRVKRIFPALMVVLASCAVGGWFVLLPGEYAQLGKHIAGGAGFASNLVLLGEASYFDTSAATKPLLHLWSLGIEEQFYLGWPLLLAFAHKRASIGLALVVVLFASFVLGLALLPGHPTAAFYSPVTRFWELLSGSALAYLTLRRSAVVTSLRPVAANVVAFLGLALVLFATRRFDADMPFPGWRALLPTVGACLLVAAGPGALVNRHLLSNRLLVGVGLISYPLYLWHWPLLTFARIVVGETPSPKIRLAAVILSFVLSFVTYRFLERPIRLGQLRRSPVGLLVGAVAALLLVGLGIAGAQGFAGPRGPWNVANVAVVDVRADQLTDTCRASEGALFVPNIDPKLDFCSERGSLAAGFDFVLVGDSHAGRLFSGMLATSHRDVLDLGRGSCLPFIGYEATNPGSTQVLGCAPTMEHLLGRAATLAHRAVILTGFFARAYDGRVVPRPGLSLAAVASRTLHDVAAKAPRVIVVLDVPELPFEPSTCVDRPYKRAGERSLCSFPRAAANAQRALYEGDLRDGAVGLPNVTFFDPATVLCDAVTCYGLRGASLLYDDPHHLSREGAGLVAAALSSEADR